MSKQKQAWGGAIAMQRRQMIKYILAGGVVAASGGGYLWVSEKRDHVELTTEVTIRKLHQLAWAPITKRGTWNPYQVFNHCAQSVEFSMTGFPESESALFQNTVGAVAFSVFAARGAMSHNLAEEIPGAPALDVGGDPQVALAHLIKVLQEFESYSGQLQPHFAFGELDKREYALAHALHINNHLQEFDLG